MKKIVYIIFLLSIFINAQNTLKPSKVTSKKYLEDQFYIGITYNLWRNKPSNIELRGFSNTSFIGYIRDFPINENRNLGFGLGLGFSRTSYFNNMKIQLIDKQTVLSNFEDIDNYDSNKLIYNAFDLPFEFRIRNSTYEKNKFFRLYLGLKLSYIFNYKATYNLESQRVSIKNFDYFNKLQYGITSSVGYGTWNGYVYYGLTPLFKDAIFNDSEKINLKTFKFGLIFYIL